MAKVYKIKWLEIFGVFNAGALMISCLIESKDSLSLCPHLKIEFFLIMDCKGSTIWEKLGMNLLTKFIYPKNDCIDFLLCGKGISKISFILSGSIYMPFLDAINPKGLP